MDVIKQVLGFVLIIGLVVAVAIGVVWGIAALSDNATQISCENLAVTSGLRTRVTGGICYIEVCQDVWMEESDVSSRIKQIQLLCGKNP